MFLSASMLITVKVYSKNSIEQATTQRSLTSLQGDIFRDCSFYLSVNNAGSGFFSAAEFVPINVAQDMFNVNFFGTFRLIKAVLPSMKARQSGHIINNTSVSGIMGMPFLEIYSASKFAVEGLSESLAPRLQQFNIR